MNVLKFIFKLIFVISFILPIRIAYAQNNKMVNTDYIHELEYDINHLIDKNYDTYFVLPDFTNYIEFKLNNDESIRTIEFIFDDTSYNYNYKIYSSSDGYEYNEVNYEKSIIDSNKEIVKTDIKDDFVRIRVFSSESEEFVHINEITFLDKNGNRIENTEITKEEPFINEVKFENKEFNYKDSISGLISRTLGEEYVNFFDVELLPDNRENDYFMLYSKDGKIFLKGNNVNSLSVALNYYYEHYLNQTFDRFGDSKLKFSLPLPEVLEVVEKEIDMELRYNYNYVAYGYTMAYWDFSDWEREIDWMALNGFNMALNLVGHEEVVRRFLSELGFSFSEITQYLTSPIYLSWQFMGNITSIGGEMTPKWFEDRAKLSIDIQNRMKEFGIAPIHQLFIGYFPDKNMGVKTFDGSYWSRIKGPNRIDFNDPNVDEIGKLFYDKQRELLGYTKYFAGDLFHEGGNSYGYDVGEVSKKVLDILKDNMGDDSVWIIQSWGHSPTYESLENLDKENILILDLHSQLNTKWTGNSKFNNMSWPVKEFGNSNWIFGVLNNFGGRNGLYGHSEHLLKQFYDAKYNSEFLKGIGQTSEAIGFNNFIDELCTELIFKDEVNLDEFVRRYVKNRYGKDSDKLVEAFNKLIKTVYNPTTEIYHEGASESVINARPSMDLSSASKWGSIHSNYDFTILEDAFRIYLSEYDKFKNNEDYINDLIDIASEVIINLANSYYKEIEVSYSENDFEKFKILSDKFLYLIKLQSSILYHNERKSLSNILSEIDNMNYDDYFKDTLKYNKKTLITTWYDKIVSDDEGLRDYANTDYYDVIGTLYYDRWKNFFDNVILNKDIEVSNNYDSYRFDVNWIYNDDFSNNIHVSKNLKDLLDLLLVEISMYRNDFSFLSNLMTSMQNFF